MPPIKRVHCKPTALRVGAWVNSNVAPRFTEKAHPLSRIGQIVSARFALITVAHLTSPRLGWEGQSRLRHRTGNGLALRVRDSAGIQALAGRRRTSRRHNGNQPRPCWSIGRSIRRASTDHAFSRSPHASPVGVAGEREFVAGSNSGRNEVSLTLSVIDAATCEVEVFALDLDADELAAQEGACNACGA